jgi:hypothetical protein
MTGPDAGTVSGFRVRSFSDKIDFVNFAQNSRPGMTPGPLHGIRSAAM